MLSSAVLNSIADAIREEDVGYCQILCMRQDQAASFLTPSTN